MLTVSTNNQLTLTGKRGRGKRGRIYFRGEPLFQV